jgi:hypothetical protein
MPPARYLSRKSPGNGDSDEKSFEAILTWNITLVRPVHLEKAFSPMLATLLKLH